MCRGTFDSTEQRHAGQIASGFGGGGSSRPLTSSSAARGRGEGASRPNAAQQTRRRLRARSSSSGTLGVVVSQDAPLPMNTVSSMVSPKGTRTETMSIPRSSSSRVAGGAYSGSERGDQGYRGGRGGGLPNLSSTQGRALKDRARQGNVSSSRVRTQGRTSRQGGGGGVRTQGMRPSMRPTGPNTFGDGPQRGSKYGGHSAMGGGGGGGTNYVAGGSGGGGGGGGSGFAGLSTSTATSADNPMSLGY